MQSIYSLPILMVPLRCIRVISGICLMQQKLAPVSGFVRIGTGRGAADVSFATMVGLAVSTQVEVWAYEDGCGDNNSSSAPNSNDAVSTA